MSNPKHSGFWSCGQEKMIFFDITEVAGCCANLKTALRPILGGYGPDGSIDIDELIDAKRSHLAAVRRGEVPTACVDCPSWQPMDRADDTPYVVNDVNIGHHTACNTDCYYCRTNSNSHPQPVAARKAPALFPHLKQMVERGYIDPDAIIRFGGGEPTILPEFEKLVHYFLEVDRRFFINSSGVKYSLAIDRMLRTARAGSRLVISIDSATDETYEIIKGLDLGKRVWDNIARYAQVGSDFLEVKYIVLPENAHETGAFVKRCHDIGVKRVSIDLDSRPIIFDIKNSLTDEIIEGAAILIYEAKRRGISVYHSGSGYALWEQEDGERRVNAAVARISGGRFTVKQSADGFLELAKIPQDLIESLIVDWGRCENVTAAPLNSEPWAIYLQEDSSLGRHRIEQFDIPVVANQTYTLDVAARPRGRKRLMIEVRDDPTTMYTCATFELERANILACTDKDAVSVGSAGDEWVRCQITFTPVSSAVVFTLALVNDEVSHVYQGEDQAGVDLRPPIIGRLPST
jgi:organic radical activating enzyme